MLGLLKKKNTKIDAFKPLKWRNSLEQIIYTCSVVCSVVKETGVAGFLTTEHMTEHVYMISRREFINFRGSCASIFMLFFLTDLKLYAEFIFISFKFITHRIQVII